LVCEVDLSPGKSSNIVFFSAVRGAKLNLIAIYKFGVGIVTTGHDKGNCLLMIQFLNFDKLDPK